jgi:hypothetical protein
MKTAILVLFVLAGCSKAVVEQPAAEPQPVTPLVYCHAQGGQVVNGKCVPHRRPS